jgi:hypothetical protein
MVKEFGLRTADPVHLKDIKAKIYQISGIFSPVKLL